MKRILGIDPGNKTGWAYVNADGKTSQGTWDLTACTDGHPGARLLMLRGYIRSIAAEFGLDLIATEDAGFGAGPGKLTVMAMHNELMGMIKATAAELKIPAPVLYVPSSIKKFATDNGKADKEQMMRAHQLHYGFAPKDDNESDARFVMEMARFGYTAHASAKPKRRKANFSKNPKNPKKPKNRLF